MQIDELRRKCVGDGPRTAARDRPSDIVARRCENERNRRGAGMGKRLKAVRGDATEQRARRWMCESMYHPRGGTNSVHSKSRKLKRMRRPMQRREDIGCKGRPVTRQWSDETQVRRGVVIECSRRCLDVTNE